MASGVGGNLGTSDFGKYRVNLGPWLTPGATAANRAAIQAEHDTLVATMRTDWGASKPMARGQLFLPSCPGPGAGGYGVGGPIDIDQDYVELVGEGEGSFLTLGNDPATGVPLACDLIRVGMTRSGSDGTTDITMDSTYRPTLAGVLDGTQGAGRYGFRTKGISFLHFQCHPFTHGKIGTWSGLSNTPDNYMQTRKLSGEMSFQIMSGGGVVPNGYTLFGCGDAGANNPTPIVCYGIGGNAVRFLLGIQAVDYGPQTTYILDLTLTGTGRHNIGFVADQTTGEFAVYADGLEKTERSISTTGHLNENKYNPFFIGDSGTYRANWGSNSGVDMIVSGFHWTPTRKYAVTGTASTQVRQDAVTPNNDAMRYFPPNSGPGSDTMSLGHLRFTEDPASGTRDLFTPGSSVGTGTLMGAGYIAHGAQANGALAARAGVALRHLRLQGGAAYGQNVAIGLSLDVTCEDVTSLYAANAFGQINGVANYVNHFLHCRGVGSDNALYSLQSFIDVDDFRCLGAGRTMIRLAGAGSRIRNPFCGGANSNSQHLIAYHAEAYGADNLLIGCVDDGESDVYHRSPIYIESSPYAARVLYKLINTNLGGNGNTPIVEINEGGAAGPTSLDIDMMTWGAAPGDTPTSFISTTSAMVRGRVRNTYMAPNVPRVVSPNGMKCQIVIEESGTVPSRLAIPYLAGSVDIQVPAPALGGYGGWDCVSGAATGDLTTWIGKDLRIARPTDLGCYFRIGTSFLGTGTAFYVGLLLDNLELSGASYARVQVLNTSVQVGTNPDGSKALIGPLVIAPVGPMTVILFAALTGTKSVNQVGIYTAATGGAATLTAAIPGTEAAPRVILSGMAPTFAPGAFVID